MPEKSSPTVETVSWINHVPLNRREKIARWWIEDVRQQHTYTSKRQREQEFTTNVPVDMIDQLACEGLKAALLRQKNNLDEDSKIFTYPRATPDGSLYFGSVTVPRRPLRVSFTSEGIVSDIDENN